MRTNLHVILCVSPVGEAFRERCRMFPGLVNCTTIDWFTEWPSDALFEVASKQLQHEDLGTEEVKTSICKVGVVRVVVSAGGGGDTGASEHDHRTCASPPQPRPPLLTGHLPRHLRPYTRPLPSAPRASSPNPPFFHPQVFVTAHQSVEETSRRMLAQLNRRNYVTPTNYLETVRGYRTLLKEKRAELGDKANKLKGGLEKLDETSIQVRCPDRQPVHRLCNQKLVFLPGTNPRCADALYEVI